MASQEILEHITAVAQEISQAPHLEELLSATASMPAIQATEVRSRLQAELAQRQQLAAQLNALIQALATPEPIPKSAIAPPDSTLTSLTSEGQARAKGQSPDPLGQPAEGYLLTDAQGTILEADPVAATLLGLGSEPWSDRSLGDFVLASERETWAARLHQLQVGEPLQVWEVTLQSAGNGKPFPAMLAVSLADPKSSSQRWRWLIRDLSDRYRALKVLQINERKFRTLFHHARQLMGLLHPDGRIINLNRAALERSGTTAEAATGVLFWELRGWGNDSEVLARLQSAIACAAAGDPACCEVQLPTAEGTQSQFEFCFQPILDQDEAGQVILLVAEGQARQSPQVPLETVPEPLVALIERSADLISLADLNGEVEFLNRAGQQLLGISATGTEALQVGDYLTPKAAEHFTREILPSVMAQGHWSGESEVQNRQTGESIPVLAQVFRLRDRTGDTGDSDSVDSGIDGPSAPSSAHKLAFVMHDIRHLKRPCAESALPLSAERYHAVLNGLKEVVFQTDINGRWTFLNAAWTKILGFSVPESLNTSCFGYLHPEDVEPCSLAFQPLIEGHNQPCRHEARYRTKSGGWRWLEIEARPLFDDNGNAIGTRGTLNDITDRKQAEDQLRAVIDTVPGLVSWVSYQGRYLGVNRRLAQTLRLSPQDFIGKDLGFLNSSPTFVQFMRQFLASPHLSANQVIEARVNGEMRSYLLAAQKYRQGSAAVSVGIDITERKQAEFALRESEAQFRQLAENIEQVFWMVDLVRQEIIYVSPAYEKTWGRDLAYAYTSWQAWLEAVHPEDYERVVAEIPKQIRGEYDIEYRIERPDGSIRWIRDRAFPVRNEQGQVYRLAGLAEDITERKKAKEALKERERYLTALVAVHRRLLASAVNHDLYHEVLEILGQVCAASRIYVYENYRDEQGNLRARECAEWCAPGISAQMQNLANQHLAYEEMFPHWYERLVRGEIIQGNVAELPQPECRFLAAQSVISVLILPLIVNGSFFGFIGFDHCRERKTWKSLEVGLLSSAAAAIALAKERHLTQEELQQQLTAIETTADGILITNAAGELRYVNPAYRRMLGYTNAEKLLAESWQRHYPEVELNRFQRDIQPQLLQTGQWSGEVTAKRKDGSTFVQELSMSLTKNGEIVAVCRDISARKRAEQQLKASLEEKDLLLKEVHHRVKNNLQVISSIFSLQSQAIEDSQALAAFAECQNRISSMALIHEKLYQSENLANIDFAEYIRELANHLLLSYNASPEWIKPHLQIEDVKLNLDTAIPCGLLINELVSNSLKHAFPNQREGEISIMLVEKEEGKLLLKVEDNGVGLPAGLNLKNTNSLGLSLITSLTQQLRGTLEINNNPGASFQITFPQPKERKRF